MPYRYFYEFILFKSKYHSINTYWYYYLKNFLYKIFADADNRVRAQTFVYGWRYTLSICTSCVHTHNHITHRSGDCKLECITWWRNIYILNITYTIPIHALLKVCSIISHSPTDIHKDEELWRLMMTTFFF